MPNVPRLRKKNAQPNCTSHVDSAFYPPWDAEMSTSQRAVMLCSWKGNRRPGRKLWQPTAGWMT